METLETLKTLNEAFRQNEKSGNADFFATHLADDLLFRRASGTLAHKTAFIQGLSGRSWTQLDNRSVEVTLDNEQDSHYAVVSLIVDYDFVVNNQPKPERKQGAARNIRFFRLEDGIWKLYAWYNEGV